MRNESQSKPVAPNVGVVAVTGDSFKGIWTTRHFMLSNLARFFRVAWLEPPRHWRNIAPVIRVPSRKVAPLEARHVKTRGVSGVIKSQPLAWVPDFYRPARIRQVIRAQRYARAARSLRNKGCDSVLLHIWRPDYVDALDSRDHFDGVIYHIDDEYSFSDTPAPVNPDEQRLLEEANAVILHSPGLADLKGHVNKRTYEVPNGVDFARYSQSFTPPADLMAIPAPRIGYAGVIRSYLDISLIRQLADRCPGWSIVLVGPLGNLAGCEQEMRVLSQLPNVHLMGYRPTQELPAYQQHFDVSIMPYRITAYTNCIYPLKVHEYLAGGKPVVGTPIRSLLDFAHVVSLASGVDDWQEKIQSCLDDGSSDVNKVALRRSVAAEHDWTLLAKKTAVIMASLLDDETERRIMALRDSAHDSGAFGARS